MINATLEDQLIKVSFNITDNLSGVNFDSFIFRSTFIDSNNCFNRTVSLK